MIRRIRRNSVLGSNAWCEQEARDDSLDKAEVWKRNQSWNVGCPVYSHTMPSHFERASERQVPADTIMEPRALHKGEQHSEVEAKRKPRTPGGCAPPVSDEDAPSVATSLDVDTQTSVSSASTGSSDSLPTVSEPDAGLAWTLDWRCPCQCLT